MIKIDCPGCRNEREYCFEHQQNEKKVYDEYDNHDTIEYQAASDAARLKDQEERGDII